MRLEFNEGDRVMYYPVGGASPKSVGVIKRIITHDETVGGRQNVHASDKVPRYVIENEHTHKEAAYKKENIIDIAP